MDKLNSLLEKGREIKEEILYVQPPRGVFRTYSVYQMKDYSAYSAWMNQVIFFLKKNIKDKDALQRFEVQSRLFDENHYDPKYMDNMLGILYAYLDDGLEEKMEEKHLNNNCPPKSVFVVHGHNEIVNNELIRSLERLGLSAIVLREQPNTGQTIIEKLEKCAEEVNFAVVLLTADDTTSEDQYRARQNVIFEMGYFMGLLGRSHVMCLLEADVEKPGDIDGIVYTPLDSAGAWKFSLVKELNGCGYSVDANKLL